MPPDWGTTCQGDSWIEDIIGGETWEIDANCTDGKVTGGGWFSMSDGRFATIEVTDGYYCEENNSYVVTGKATIHNPDGSTETYDCEVVLDGSSKYPIPLWAPKDFAKLTILNYDGTDPLEIKYEGNVHHHNTWDRMLSNIGSKVKEAVRPTPIIPPILPFVKFLTKVIKRD